MLDKWDYCLRRLFVTKTTPLQTAIRYRTLILRPSFSTKDSIPFPPSHLAPGAEILIKALTKPGLPESERVDVKKIVKALTVHDWALLLKAFDEWTFAPEVSQPFRAFVPRF
jgi:transcription factor 1